MRVINRYYTHKQVLFNKRINDNLEQQDRRCSSLGSWKNLILNGQREVYLI